ncbi:nucleoside hydrolase [Actinomadura sp. 7K507]|uniref:nucleoside hydrolase n=1 Tax=Actinomadura sp. 7K507 TaxID=2530365 RepID=UPI00104D8D64|nr:nucleoside hydrolase [Actinomadura sp. 7K507]TDC85687.1 nucleoside hydrolase [Actinomadura sp. 7K507]
MKRMLGAVLLALPLLVPMSAHADDRPPVIIFDTDMDYDDAAALAYLAQEHRRGRIELRAVTVVNNGGGLPGRAIRNARCLVERLGLRGVPVADGSDTAPNRFPDEILQTVDTVVTSLTTGCTATETPSRVRAPKLIRRVLRREPSAQIIATGPLSNVAAALPEAAGRVTSMGGAIDVPGNLCCGTPPEFDGTQEFNYWIDPAASRTFIRRNPRPVRLVPLNATNDVPITQEFVDRLREDHRTPAADVVFEAFTHPAVQPLIADGLLFWWDPLAAMSAVHPEVLQVTRGRVDVVPDGPAAGRTFLSRTGRPITYGVAADGAAFEQRFLNILNGRR